MISSIEIARFRGIREGKIEELTPLVVLVGPNGCGKSSVLDALFIGAKPNAENAGGMVIQRHTGVKNGGRWLFWRAQEHEVSIIVRTSAGESRAICVRRHRELGRIEYLLQVNSRLVSAQGKSLSDVPDVRLIDPRLFEKQTPLHRLYTEFVVHGRRSEAKAIVSEVVPEVKDLEILTEEDTPILHLVFADYSVPVAFAGDGVYSFVQLSLELASHPGGVVLFEEPEVHQHPAAIRQTVRAILAAVRRGIQVILSTHSLELIDTLLAESQEEDLERLSVYRLQLRDGELTSRRMPGSEVAFLRSEIENDLR